MSVESKMVVSIEELTIEVKRHMLEVANKLMDEEYLVACIILADTGPKMTTAAVGGAKSMASLVSRFLQHSTTRWQRFKLGAHLMMSAVFSGSDEEAGDDDE